MIKYDQVHGLCFALVPVQITDFMVHVFQERLIKATVFAHETFGAYRTVEELWDGEV